MVATIFALFATTAAHSWAQGLAAKYPGDQGIESDPDVLYFLDFDDRQATLDWSAGKTGYGWTDIAEHVFFGDGALEIQQTTGTHAPSEIHPKVEPSDVVYVRWYRKWEPGYDFQQHKMPGVYAKASDNTSAGEVPTGYDKYSCKLFVDFDRYPRFYSYHPDQAGIWGDAFHMNLVDPKIQIEAGRWYCFEMMIKANNSPARDGELKMWIDGQLVGHIEDMRFRDTNDLKINEFTYSAYVGGDWVSLRDQKLWDDQIVVARSYIGPLVEPSSADAAITADAGAGMDIGNSPSDASPTGPDTQAPRDASVVDAAGDASREDERGLDGGCALGGQPPRSLSVLALLFALVSSSRRRRSR